MKRLLKGLVCTVSVVSLILPDMAMAAEQMQPERQTTARQRRAQTRPARPVRRQQARPARQTTERTRTRTTRTVERARARPVRTVERTRTTVRTARRPSTYRIGHRPSTFHRIRGRAFHYPRGYRYRRFRTGLILPALFLSSAYFFNDYYSLGLGPPPPGYVWVRYGPDLLLVSRHTGRVVDVIYGAFY
jgi:Ni/Co efflux regulator RcnB